MPCAGRQHPVDSIIFGFGGLSGVIAVQGSDAPIKGLDFGLNDQRLALIWAKRNIAAFGGDDTKITIMDHSAGGISLLLFRKAGVFSRPKADNRRADLCRLWSVQAQSPFEPLEMLRRIPTKDLLNSVSELHWKLFTLTIDELTFRKSNLGPGFALVANWDYTKFHSLFTSSYDELLESFSQFISDSTMMHKVYRGYKFFQARHPRRVGVYSSHFEIGNPFPGPLRGISHHGVELIYAFGHFYHALEKANQGILQGYADPDHAHVEPDVDEPSMDAETRRYCKPNIDLSYEMQDRWIRFVVEDCQETAQHANADDIITFGSDPIQRDFDSMTNATQRLLGRVLN
ncbi:Alpha/Beta hydrolase protein [Aspergillus bertholletiae]|uniref:Alpha/Beta hydrolase protein n=1 Tax=Aspergillus bertholletiae TaxID=1226010 RepID=A0A5N7ATX0_9EURO|nr:Alpha/Beta hydrolase protein [Aspergillus bertholletiae]